MERKKTSDRLFWFFCLLIVVGCAWLIYQKYMARDLRGAITGDGALRITISEAKANDLLQAMLPADVPIQNPKVRFTDDGITVSGIADSAGLINANVELAYPELSAVKRLLPRNVAFSAHFLVGTENGTPRITPQNFTLEQYSIPLGLLPRTVQTTISDLILSQIDRAGLTLTELQASAGELTLSVK